MKNNEYQLFIGSFIVILFFKYFTGYVSASPPAPAPKCNVEGVIKDVRFEKAYESECLKTNSCPTDTRTKFPDLYYVTVKIEKVSYKDGNTNFQTCDSLFPINSIKEITIVASSLKDGNTLKNDQNIKGIVSSFWGHSFEAYDLSSSLSDNSVSDIRYGHAEDYSWISGQLQYYSLEGGCWSIKFSDKEGNEDNYWGIFGLEFDNPQLVNKLKEGDFVTFSGNVKGQQVSMACPQNIYTVTGIEDENILPETPPGIFASIKSFMSGILNYIYNFLNGDKSTT